MKKTALTGVFLAAALASATGWSAGDAQAGKGKSATCVACHGPDGNSAAPTFPKLAGQGAPYLFKQLRDFKDASARSAATMTPMVAPLSDQDMLDLSAYYAAQKPSFGVADESMVALGETIYRGGITGSNIGACIGCHGPRGAGNPAARFPAVSGQHSAYLADQLMKFRSGERGNDPQRMMRNIANRMTDVEIRAVASYMAGLY